MPVVDVEVGRGSQRDEKHRYHCHNRPPFNEVCTSSHGDTWPFRMSHECRYDRSLSDRFCDGCCHAGSGERYIEEREAEGAK